MKVAKVIGNIWATRKEEKLAGLKLLLVQPLDVLTGKAERPPNVGAPAPISSAPAWGRLCSWSEAVRPAAPPAI